ncbi:hypothetical protein [Brochothrix campestris]|uniref:Uncharacterized protein n=1 Tax=Brochothrix campestris FSL F6-1037 TaxID=1265861 RepID=W7CM54_9LIST|nr:hypothetical protein [Brochothrix campestris]EUJ34198.1 hypothetical protein BCAMP_12603 [Brochothrix campestris FSL F6-1037]
MIHERKDFEYLICTSSEADEVNHQILLNCLNEKYPFFEGDSDNPEFKMKLISEEAKENDVIQFSFNIKRTYRLNSIEVWKKEKGSSSRYDKGILFYEENSELLLGRWGDWLFSENDKELQEKDRRISKLEGACEYEGS